uniref:Uncharacterized protein n=1 Tax=Anguilla anguilla TaxID=7936 RepID=A0A0E9WIP5_ANGAN
MNYKLISGNVPQVLKLCTATSKSNYCKSKVLFDKSAVSSLYGFGECNKTDKVSQHRCICKEQASLT